MPVVIIWPYSGATKSPLGYSEETESVILGRKKKIIQENLNSFSCVLKELTHVLPFTPIELLLILQLTLNEE